jgi:pimeloyl-ACP methyl ester carboxylesterase
LLDHLKMDELVIGGLSMGGYVTFALFRRSPDRFSGMLLADTKAEADTADGRTARVAMRTLLSERGPDGVADQMLPKLLSDATRAADPTLVDNTRRLIVSNHRDAIDQAIVAMMARPDSGPDLEKVSVPALVVVGEHDVLTPPADAERLHARMSRSILTVIPEAGHLANVERPTEFTRALHDFLVAHV